MVAVNVDLSSNLDLKEFFVLVFYLDNIVSSDQEYCDFRQSMFERPPKIIFTTTSIEAVCRDFQRVSHHDIPTITVFQLFDRLIF